MNTLRRTFLFSTPLAMTALCLAGQTAGPNQNGGAAGDVSGKWHFVFDTEGGPRNFDADFKVDGKTVTGTWDGKPDVKGTYQDGKLDLEFHVVSEEAGPGTLKLSGKASETITGNWSFENYSGSFTATRPKA
jgi:hypothetical protein